MPVSINQAFRMRGTNPNATKGDARPSLDFPVNGARSKLQRIIRFRHWRPALPKAIGLDFGTTNSALACANPDRTVTLAEFSGSSTFRSILYFDEDENQRASKLRVTAGPDAIKSYLSARTPGRLIQSTKSYLASR